MFELALKAGIPLIKISTDDVLNIQEVLAFYAEIPCEPATTNFWHSKHNLFYTFTTAELTLNTLYSNLIDQEKVLVLVNVDVESPYIFDAGRVPTPKRLVKKHLEAILEDEALNSVLAVMGGLSLKEVAEVSRLATAYGDALTPESVMKVRRMLMTRLRGMSPVDTELPYYYAPDILVEWINNNKEIFLACEEPRLIPRGLMFEGDPGTGKTLAAKFIANSLQLPLYLLDIGGMMQKYVGESESNLDTVLSQVDSQSPCILLMDEVEKMYTQSDDSGVSTRMLSKILWFLQEHKSRILTIMTTNDKSKLPPELYRPGRIDECMVFPPLTKECEIKIFYLQVLESLDLELVDQYHTDIVAIILSNISKLKSTAVEVSDFSISHANLTQIVYNSVKKLIRNLSTAS